MSLLFNTDIISSKSNYFIFPTEFKPFQRKPILVKLEQLYKLAMFELVEQKWRSQRNKTNRNLHGLNIENTSSYKSNKQSIINFCSHPTTTPEQMQNKQCTAVLPPSATQSLLVDKFKLYTCF